MSVDTSKVGLIAPAVAPSTPGFGLRELVRAIARHIALYMQAFSAAQIASHTVEHRRLINDDQRAELVRRITPS